MLYEPQYSFLENNRFSRESSYTEKQLREFFNQGRIDRETELWLWDGSYSRLAGTYESLFIRNRRFKERRLGVFGAKNSGKTIFLDCCIKFGKNSDETVPAESKGQGISIVDFSLVYDGMAWEILTQDYPGEFKTAKIDEWFDESDAVLLLIDGSESADQTENLRIFLDQLRRHSPDGNRINKPITVIWTKSDLYENPNRRHEIRELIEIFVPPDWIKEFFVSAFQPEKMREPVFWTVRKIDEILYENIAQSSSIPKRKILNEYRKLRNVWGINYGEFGEKIDREIRKLEKEQKRRLILLAVIGNVVVFVLIFVAAVFVRNNVKAADAERYRTALLNIEQAENRKAVETALEDYRNQFFSSKPYLEELENSAQNKIRILSVRYAESAFRAAKYAIEHAETPEKIDQIITQFRNEVSIHSPEQLDELVTFATTIRQSLQLKFAVQWERSSYENFKRQASSAKTSDDLKKADDLAKEYLMDAEKRAALGLTNHRKPDVEAWREWFDRLKQEHPREIVIKTIDIPKSFFKGKNLEGKITILLQIGKTKAEISIPQLDEKQKSSDPIRFSFDLICSVDNAVWDKQKSTKISLTILEYLKGWRYWGGAASKAVCEVAGSEYPYIEFCPKPNGVFTFQADQLTIIVTTDPKCLNMP
jgi:GTPase SAR1 family protein